MAYQEEFMELAIELAQEGKDTKGGGPFGAVITRNNEVITSCFNVVGASQNLTQHAELRCIQMACEKLNSKDLSDCELYTSCVPCMMCLGAIKWGQFKKVYYGACAQMAKEAGFIYSDMFYGCCSEKRDKEFHMHQHLAEKAAAVWSN